MSAAVFGDVTSANVVGYSNLSLQDDGKQMTCAMFRDFDKKLLKSITEPIIISEDDSDEVKELKCAVREAKIDLKVRMDAGEDISKTMSDTWHQLQELGLYRKELRKEVAKYAHDKNISKEDMEDFVKAANTMLEQRGGMPITMPEFYKHRLELREARQKLLKKVTSKRREK